MSRFLEDAVQLLSAAENVLESGHTPADTAILITPGGGIRMVAESDWPLDSLQRHYGAKTAYRITGENGKVRIEGREGARACRLESEDPARIARHLLGAYAHFTA